MGERVDSDPHYPDGHGLGMSSLVTGGDASGTRTRVAPDAWPDRYVVPDVVRPGIDVLGTVPARRGAAAP